MKDKLPLFAPEVDQQELIAQMKEALPGFIDVTDALSAHKDEDIFYKKMCIRDRRIGLELQMYLWI